MDTKTKPASQKQTDYIKALGEPRLQPDTYASVVAAIEKGITSEGASNLIDLLLKTPKRDGFVPLNRNDEIQNALKTIPKSKYALRVEDLEWAAPDLNARGNDTIFLEVREFKNRLYFNRLHGSLGDFRRTRVPYHNTSALINAIKKNPTAAVQLFGSLFSCCGCCGAPLTDAESRRLNLGPECRKRFNL